MITSSGGRSPAYPQISLENAIVRLDQLYKYAKRNSVNAIGVYKHWGYSGATSNARNTLAALRYFGLIDVSRTASSKTVSVSSRGLRIQLDHTSSEERQAKLKEAALSPAMYKYCWDKYGSDMPHDDAVKSNLIFEKHFNESSVSGFLSDYKKTINYAKLNEEYPILQSSDHEDDEEDFKKDVEIEVGDLVQWESDGVLQLPSPQIVRALQEYESGDVWVFIEGSETGLPMEEIIIEEKKSIDKVRPTLPLMKEDRGMGLQENEREWVRGPLSKDTRYRIIVSGELGPTEIGKLIRVLNAQKDILSDDEEQSNKN